MNFEAFNLNDHVRVKLNDLGFVTWKQEFEKYLPEEYHKPLSDFVARADDEGYVDFQAWSFINLFGEHVYMAGPSLFDLTILIQRPEPTPPPAPRPLSSLTDAECAECYRLAFGNEYEPEKIAHHQDGKGVSIWTDDKDELEMYVTGVMSGLNSCYGERPVSFNAVAVVRFLDSIGIFL